MEARYQELFRLPENMHQEGCPVFLEAGALLRDNVNGKVLAQLKLKNLSIRNIVSCTVEIRASAVNGDALEGVTFQYQDLSVAGEGNFGAKTPIFLPDTNTRRLEVIIREVVQEPFRVWTATSDAVSPLPVATRLNNLLGDEQHIERYEIRVGAPCEFIPEQKQGLFLCTCGRVNLIDDGNCAGCGRTFEELSQALDPDAIHAEVLELLRIEEEERLEAERAAEQDRLEKEQAAAAAAEARRIRKEAARKKTAKIAKIVIPTVLAVVLVFVLATYVIIPAVQNSNAYKAATAMQEQGAYLDAEAAFRNLGDYKDSAQQASQSRYLYAQSLYLDKSYEKAIAEWEKLGGYSDSAQRAADALTEWKEADYQEALALKEAGEYKVAAEAFAVLGDYKDSMEQQGNCVELQNDVDYTAAADALAAGEYQTAMDGFQKLGGYRDAQEQYLASAYACAEDLYQNKKYKEAVEYFEIAKNYQDAAERKTDSVYQYACALCENKDYAAAITQFQKCISYKDAKEKTLDAKFGFVKAKMDAKDQTSYNYMKELVAANYKGAKKLFNELYAWKVEVVAFNNDPNNSTVSLSSLSKYQYMCVHFKLTGGEPGAKVNIRTTLTLPNGQSGSIPHAGVTSGYIGCSYGWYNEPAYGSTGTLTFRAYDENNKLICTATVRVTN